MAEQKQNNMKTWEEINVEEKLSLEDFLTLFSKLSLLPEEKEELSNYHAIYETFLLSDVSPKDAWIVTRNIFAVKNGQIADRMKRIEEADAYNSNDIGDLGPGINY